MKINTKDNKIVIPIKLNIYPLEAIYGASYLFLDRTYIYLEEGGDSTVIVNIKGKEAINKKKLEKIGYEFLNELLNAGLRHQISSSNKKIREYIAGTALFYSSKVSKQGDLILESEKESITKNDWLDDPMGIAVPWEEKFAEKKMSSKEKGCNAV